MCLYFSIVTNNKCLMRTCQFGVSSDPLMLDNYIPQSEKNLLLFNLVFPPRPDIDRQEVSSGLWTFQAVESIAAHNIIYGAMRSLLNFIFKTANI